MHGGIIASYADFKELVGNVQGFYERTRLIGLLFMREGQDITDKNIVPSLDYFDLRSGNDLQFILPGWRKLTAGRGSAPPAKKWVYDNERFIQACDLISAETKWRYSGGTDLLLLTTHRHSNLDIVIDFSAAINIRLHAMREQKLEDTPEIVLQRMIDFARSYKGAAPLQKLSLQEARVSLFEGIVNAVIGSISKDIKDRVQYARQFVIKDVSRNDNSNRTLLISQ